MVFFSKLKRRIGSRKSKEQEDINTNTNIYNIVSKQNSINSTKSATLSPNNMISKYSNNSILSEGSTNSYKVRFVRNSNSQSLFKRNSQTYMNKNFYKNGSQAFINELKEEQAEDLMKSLAFIDELKDDHSRMRIDELKEDHCRK